MAPVMTSRSLGVNTAANFVSQFVGPALGLLLVPVYLHYLGLAGYGLVSLLAALLSFSGIFTRGIGWSLQREVARADSAGEPGRVRSLVRTFELGYWAIGVVLGVLLAATSGAVSGLLDNGKVDGRTVQTCLLILAVRLGALFPASVYQAALLGSRRQLLLNVVNSGALLVGTGAQLLAVATTRSLVALYVADLSVAAVTLLVLRACVWRVSATAAPSPLLRLADLRAMAGMSAGLAWTQAVGMVTRQLDRFVVGGLTSLASLGVYSAGVAGGRLLSLSYNPYLTAVFPESCALVRDAPDELPGHLARNSRIVALTAFGVGIPVTLYGRELLTVWLGAGQLASDAYPVLVVYVIGCMVLGLADTQYQLHTAIGTSRCGVLVNGAAIVWLPLTMIGLVHLYGIVGAAATWALYATTTWFAFTAFTYRVLMPGHLGPYLRQVITPILLLAALDGAADLVWRLVLPDDPWAVLAAAVPSSLLVLTVVTAYTVGIHELSTLLPGGRRSSRPRPVTASEET